MNRSHSAIMRYMMRSFAGFAWFRCIFLSLGISTEHCSNSSGPRKDLSNADTPWRNPWLGASKSTCNGLDGCSNLPLRQRCGGFVVVSYDIYDQIISNHFNYLQFVILTAVSLTLGDLEVRLLARDEYLLGGLLRGTLSISP